MKTKTMSALLRAVLLAAGALLAVFFFPFLPFYGTDTVRAAPEFAWAYWPCLVWRGRLPCRSSGPWSRRGESAAALL